MAQGTSKIFNRIYNKKNLKLWNGDKTMSHASGIWGREKMFSYLKQVIKPGDTVIDLGCGTGYPTAWMAQTLVKKGKVCGYDSNKVFIASAKKEYTTIKNLSFQEVDITSRLPLMDNSVDVFISFMVLQNLTGSQIHKMFKEIRRTLKPDGKAMFLSLSPDIFKKNWDLNFLKYSEAGIKKWRNTRKDDTKLTGYAKNVLGEKIPFILFTHSIGQIKALLHKNLLSLLGNVPIYIDRARAIEVFGKGSIRRLPSNPIYWIFCVTK